MTTAVEAEIVDDQQAVAVLPTGGALAALNASEIDMQIATAHKFPRSIKRFQARCEEMATLDEDTAGSMFYRLPRGGKTIEGPSARFAEVVAASYQNLRCGARIIDITDTQVIAQGACHDLENNIAMQVEVRRRITNKHGQRYDEDMIGVTCNAACSIAYRNALFKVVPMALTKAILEKAKLTSIGKATSLNETRHKMVDAFKKLGATEAQVLAVVNKPGIADIDTDDLVTLRGMYTAIREGDSTLEQALGLEPAAGPAKVKKSRLNDQVSGKADTPAAGGEDGLALEAWEADTREALGQLRTASDRSKFIQTLRLDERLSDAQRGILDRLARTA